MHFNDQEHPFYEKLEDNKYVAKYVVGHFSAKILKREHLYWGIIKMHSKSSENGLRLVNFAARKLIHEL